jgi:hypothetical protein
VRAGLALRQEVVEATEDTEAQRHADSDRLKDYIDSHPLKNADECVSPPGPRASLRFMDRLREHSTDSGLATWHALIYRSHFL